MSTWGVANRAGYRIIAWYDDPAVSGCDAIDARPGFRAVLDQIAGNGVHAIIVETASRFARDLMVQEAGYARLRAEGIDLIAADKPDAFTDDSPTARMVRQILGAVAEFDKAMTVAKLRGARERKRRTTGGKVEGRKTYAEKRPEMVSLARELARPPEGFARGPSLRKVAAELAARGFTTPKGKPYSASAVQRCLGKPREPQSCHDRYFPLI